jgi:hypothetical protein
VRDFGRIVSDSFLLFRQHWRPLFRAIGVLCVPAVLLCGLLIGKGIGDMQSLQAYARDADDVAGFMLTNLVPLLAGYAVFLLVYVLVVAVAHEYLRAYHLGEHHGITPAELWRRAREQYLSYLGAGFLCGLLIGIGFVLCIVPGFYPLAVLALVFPAHAIERTGGAGALARSNALVSGDFWPTLGLVVVMGLILWVLNTVVNLPFAIAGAVIGFNSVWTSLGEPGGQVYPDWYSLFSAAQMAFQLVTSVLIYPLGAFAMGLKYFSRVEEREGLGLGQRIQGFENA